MIPYESGDDVFQKAQSENEQEYCGAVIDEQQKP